MLEIVQIPVLSDNYVYLLHEGVSGQTAVVDPAEAEPVLAALAQRRWTLDYVLNTHHHWDHVGANPALKQATGCRVVGFRGDARRIPGIDVQLAEGDVFELGECRARVLEVPGHTLGHVAYWFEADAALFCGDTLFALGCGRLFEGTPAQMWDSLCKLRMLPDQTWVYCAHEYTLKNARFALTIEPDHPPLLERVRRVEALRAQDLPTVPSLLGEEKATNPFLRADVPELQASLGMAGAPAVEVFAELRRRRDRF
ncbi:hydroxyacylglutathione hydrolase [Methylomarinovum caldicuralii]|uniref:Hydroxyacylglutathione hydrolase n=1 Tax=Methylomarinovum caldicuralii TaxID=438856 RepID=A0AAU9CPL2_9GAMM|nr:hydroxyacylglutathione hydrolase [Methylomarinovum caldicuralii]BCX81462.1 hydroxyacylglutathione hydrolase [Methylomarinovum caldicuralii]